MTTQQAREILGKNAKGITDEELQEIISTFVAISDIAIDEYLRKRKSNNKVK